MYTVIVGDRQNLSTEPFIQCESIIDALEVVVHAMRKHKEPGTNIYVVDSNRFIVEGMSWRFHRNNWVVVLKPKKKSS